MAFGITKDELKQWKREVKNGEIAFLTHYWIHPKFPDCKTVTKAGCIDLNRLIDWGISHGLQKEWIDRRPDYPHFDLIGEKQIEVLTDEGLANHLSRFHLLYQA